MIKLLIDECLSAGLVPLARQRGYLADHVVHIGLGGCQDWNLMPVIEAGDYLFVTNNRLDFLRLYAKQTLHNGLIVIVPNTERQQQCELLTAALDHLEERHDLVNHKMEVESDGAVTVVAFPEPR